MMATFTALNIEPDDQTEDEVDNTKELQIEDALKLYQVALKLHAQGPEYYAQAAASYQTLFNSEIFKYPESTPEFVRLDLNPELEFPDAVLPPGLELAIPGPNEIPSTLPQILYLAYKNHGQFILDCVKSRLSTHYMPKPELEYQARASIDYFALALTSDESDTELWRRVARVGAMVGSRRIARYCLEAAVEVDDDPTVSEVDPVSLEEGFAGEQLKEVLGILGDESSLSHPIMKPYLNKAMPSFLTKHMDLYKFLPDPTKELDSDKSSQVPEMVQQRILISVDARSWTSIGDRLCEYYLTSMGQLGTAIVLELPPSIAPSMEVAMIEAPGTETPAMEATMTKGQAMGTPLTETPNADMSNSGEPAAEEIATKTPTPGAIALAEDEVMRDAGKEEHPVPIGGDAAMSVPESNKAAEPAVEIVTTTTTVPLSDGPCQSSIGLPTRKRSQSAAGFRESPDEDNSTQKRSKRIRNRTDTGEVLVDPATQYQKHLEPYVKGDNAVFTFVHALLAKIDVDDLGTFPELQAALAPGERALRDEIVKNTAVRDLRDILKTWDDEKGSTFVNAVAADVLGSSLSSANAGLAAFLEHANTGGLKLSNLSPFPEAKGLVEFAQKVDASWMPLQDVIWEWLRLVLHTYQTKLWPEALKVCVVRIISYIDADIFHRLQLDIERARRDDGDLAELETMAETLFELHIDIYSRITNPNSAVPYETRIMTKDRLDRWADFAADVIRSRKHDSSDELSLRYVWASVFYAAMAESSTREHKVLCWSDLQALLKDSGQPSIELQNNAVMSDISVEAAEREVSRLTTMDFFFNLFQTDRSDPIAIIETLEPVLDPDSACERPEVEGDEAVEPADSTRAALKDMWKFLKSGSTSLRLFLWQRLREAYFSIGYNTKVFSCHLKSIEIIVADLRADDYVDSAEEPRRHKLLIWLKALDDLLVKALTIALNEASTCFHILDERHLKSTCAAIAQLNRILHSAAVFDDEVRVGMIELPQTAAFTQHGTFNGFITKLREMQVRTWALQYTMIKEIMSQNKELFQTPDHDLADYLSLVHYSLGLRKFCKASNKIFLKMMKVEMIRLKHIDKWEDYLGQVLYDLYGLQLGVGTYELEQHSCPTEQLNRRTVFDIAEQVINLAKGMSMKELLKHELRSTIEKMQAAVGQAKSTPQMLHNLRNYTEYLKTSIRPLDLAKAWRGQVMVDSLPVVTPESPLAEQGWYFLLGMIALAKFRSQKRISPGAQTDDMKVGATFMRLQLQFNADDWETWYRLAQCFDYELEEDILWSSDKINNHRADLVRMQRGSIHCYVMALSTSLRCADASLGTAEKLSEMYFDFGMRIYSSSRDPFNMEPFWLDDFEKHVSASAGMFKRPLHEEVTPYSAWKYASRLFKEALRDRPDNWMIHYMRGKCLWKMYNKADKDYNPHTMRKRPSRESVLHAFENAIIYAPSQRDSRQEPILEPHYKLVSIVYKFVRQGDMGFQAGVDLLQKQPYAINKGEPYNISNREEWNSYILACLKHLRAADKQHWHHRMVARAASIVFDEHQPDYNQAAAARVEFRESIFTKTMQIQVWKPESERPGRHCVYMERYVRLMNQLLWLTDDKEMMEALVKRVRKRANDFHRFEKVWMDCVNIYLSLIRKAARIPESMDDTFKTISHDEYDLFADRLEGWVADARMSHPSLDALRELSELKKLNMNLVRPTTIDDLIAEAYAVLYIQVAKILPGPEASSLAHTQSDGAAASRMGPMSLNNLVMDMGNGTQIPVPVTFAGSEPSRPRKLGISRRDILRRAEAAISKLPDVPRVTDKGKEKQRIEQNVPEPMVLGSNAPPIRTTKSNSGSATRNSTPQVEQGVSRATTLHGQDQDVEMEDQGQEEPQSQEQHEELEDGEPMDHEAESGLEPEGNELPDDGIVGNGVDPDMDEEQEERENDRVDYSADDESDLSDVPDMDDVDQATIFGPSHMGRTDRSEGDSESVGSDESEDSEDESESGIV